MCIRDRACIVLHRIVHGLRKKKMHYLYLIDEAIGVLNTEIRLVEWRIKFPEQFGKYTNKKTLSPLYLTDVYKRQEGKDRL